MGTLGWWLHYGKDNSLSSRVMNARQFFNRVAQLRKFQKEYFATRSKDALRQSIALEKEIDTEIERVQALLKDKPIKQPNLFTNG